MPISLDPEAVQAIATSCNTSSENMTREANNMKSQINQLHDAIRGIPGLAIEDHFDQLLSTFSQMSTSLEQANAYLSQVKRQIDDFVLGLQRH